MIYGNYAGIYLFPVMRKMKCSDDLLKLIPTKEEINKKYYDE